MKPPNNAPMKLHWFSPLPPARTDIAHYTARVLGALAARADVTLWTDQTHWDASLGRRAEVRRFRADHFPWAELNRGGVCVYHIGNNPLFHGAIWQVSRRCPGVVALHDLRLHHFFDGLYREQWDDRDGYLTEMEYYYGAEGRRDGEENFRTSAARIDEMAARYPLTQLACENSLGVVAHTREAYDELRQENSRPVAYLPLPFAAGASHEAVSRRPGGAVSGAGGPPFRLIVFGYVGRNRQLDELLAALAAFPGKDRFRLDVYGQLLIDEGRVRARIAELGLDERVTLRGFVPERELDEALGRAHLAVNLRYPTMGEASGSQLRIWAHALPSLVTETGWYATLPPDAVRFVRPGHAVADVQAHLREFLSDPAGFAEMGARGRRVLEEQHAPDAYAAALLEFARRAAGFRPHAAAAKLARRAGSLMDEWAEVNLSHAGAARVAGHILALAGGPRERGESK